MAFLNRLDWKVWAGVALGAFWLTFTTDNVALRALLKAVGAVCSCMVGVASVFERGGIENLRATEAILDRLIAEDAITSYEHVGWRSPDGGFHDLVAVAPDDWRGLFVARDPSVDEPYRTPRG